MSYKKGIDVSQFQGEIDWEKVKPQIDFVILRAGYGAGNIDPYFVRNASECTRLGIPFGIYWFSYAWTADMAANEAEYCLDAIAPYKLSYPVFYDFEYDSVSRAQSHGVTVTKALATEIVDTFLTAVKQVGYQVMNYSNPNYLNQYFDSALLDKYDLWLAQYLNSPDPDSPPRDCAIWQYSSMESIDGISGNVDCNAAYKDFESEDEMAKIIDQIAANCNTTPDDIIVRLSVLCANANTTIEPCETDGVAYLKTQGIITSDHDPREPIGYGTYGIMKQREANKN